MKNQILHNHFQVFHSSPQNRASLLYQFVKYLTLMLLPKQTMAEEIAPSTIDLQEICIILI